MKNVIIKTKAEYTELNYRLDIDEKRTSDQKIMIRSSPRTCRNGEWGWGFFVNLKEQLKAMHGRL